MSGPSATMAGSLLTLESAIKADTAALSALERAQKNLGKGTSVSIDAQRQLQQQIDAKKGAIASATTQFVKMGGATATADGSLAKQRTAAREAAKAATEGQQKLKGMADAFAQSGVAGSGLVSQVQRLGALAGSAGILGLVVITALAITGAFTAASIAVQVFAIKAADAGRASMLLMEGVARAYETGVSLSRAADEVASRVALARSRVQEMTRELSLAGLKGDDLRSALGGLATAAAVAGDAAASKLRGIVDTAISARRFLVSPLDLKGSGLLAADIYRALAEQLKISVQDARRRLQEGRVTVSDGIAAMEKAIEDRFGHIARRQLLSLDVQAQKAKENLAKLFEGVPIERFLEGLKEVLSVLDTNTVAGAALRDLFTSIFGGGANAAAGAAPLIKSFFLGIISGALDIEFVLLPIMGRVYKALGGEPGKGLETAFEIGGLAAAAFAAAITMSVLVVGLLAAAITAVIAPIAAVGFATGYAAAALVDLAMTIVGEIGKAIDWLGALDLGEIATNIVDTLIDGIKSKLTSVGDAFKSLGTAAKNALRSALGIKSPSKVAEDVVDRVEEGIGVGAKKNKQKVSQSINAMMRAPSRAEARNAAADAMKGAEGQLGDGGGGGVTVDLRGAQFNFHGVQGAEDAIEQLKAGVVEALRDSLASLGHGLVPQGG